MKKRLVCLTLAIIMSAAQVVSVGATREDELRQEQAQTSNQLDATYATINNLEEQKEALASEIAALDQNLVDVMVQINVLKQDISNKESDIKTTKKKLKKAIKNKEKQYEDMNKRIQYLYENGGDTAWFQMLVNSKDISDLLNKADYAQKMYDYDRARLKKYTNTVKKVKSLKTQLEGEKAELVDMKKQQEAQQASLEQQIEEKKATSADYEQQIAAAQAQAEQYAALLQQQTEEIARLEAERIAAEEEARRQAEAAAAAQAAAEEAARRQAEAEAEESYEEDYEDDSYDYEEDYDDETNEDDYADYDDEEYSDEEYYEEETGDEEYYDEEESYEEESYEEESEGEYSEGETDEYGNVIDSSESSEPVESSGGSSSGQSIADFALQFVGNPYVWGGTSLTNGADCSGFVQSVYANFGYSLSRTSESQMYEGRSVSYSEAQPGDLICYGSHVAIYLGNGQIVHASNSAPYPAGGIKVSDNAAYRTILSVRRIVD